MAATSKDAEKASMTKKTVVRSPKWPALTFNDALAKARLIYDKENRNATSSAVIFQHLGFRVKTGPAGRMLSALGQYGLLDKKEGAKYAISDKAFRLFHLPEDAPERGQIQRELALRPPLFKELVAKYRNTGLPSDATLKSYLVLDRDFNANTVEIFLKVFKAAIGIAKPFDGGYTFPAPDDLSVDEGEEEDVDIQRTRDDPSQGRAAVPLQPPAVPQGQLPFPLYLSKTEKAMLYVPASLTRKQYDLLRKQIENSYAVMEATILADDSDDD